jgi:ribosome biogenesis GTPase
VSDEKLSRRQRLRIEARSEERLERGASAAAGEETGIVVSHLRSEIEVLPATGDDTVRCFLRATVPAVVTGDRVLLERDPEEQGRGVIVALLPRRRLLARHTARGLRPVCANLDLLLVTIAPAPAPHADLVDRYLLAAALDALDAVIVLNKADAIAAGARAELDALLDPRRALGIDVLEVSAHSGAGLAALREAIASRSAAFVGQSGVGKSSLLNALVPDADAETGALSARRNRGRGRGRHTTSTTRLYRSGEALIIDSPGIREFAPDVPDEATLTRGFPEIAAVAERCRFADCRHEDEPACAVRAALEAGTLDSSRLASFRLLREALLTPGH